MAFGMFIHVQKLFTAASASVRFLGSTQRTCSQRPFNLMQGNTTGRTLTRHVETEASKPVLPRR